MLVSGGLGQLQKIGGQAIMQEPFQEQGGQTGLVTLGSEARGAGLTQPKTAEIKSLRKKRPHTCYA
ncbi:hypothetical protein AM218_02530 [Hymenobacter sp. DG25A]|nr:hypothetical protein AM218_02530 [Hymenobacter sp. DG25A]